MLRLNCGTWDISLPVGRVSIYLSDGKWFEAIQLFKNPHATTAHILSLEFNYFEGHLGGSVF